MRTGADILLARRLDLLDGRRVGIITNQTGVLSSGTPLADTLLARGVRVTLLFSPEHGIRGTADAGTAVGDTRDPATGLRVISLYGATARPPRAMLDSIDILLYDLQDVGARCYTYLSTMKLAMEAAAEAGRPFIVLDRPNPLGGLAVCGPILEDSLRSFVGALPVPMVYGLTCGEMASMINGEGWLAGGVRADLTVIPMEGWRRSMRWEETGLHWVRPSPNMTTPGTARAYPGMVLLEATGLSEGRGTDEPFLLAGAPDADGESVARDLSARSWPGVSVEAAQFTPRSSKHAGRPCSGIRLAVERLDRVDPVALGVGVVQAFRRYSSGRFNIDSPFLGKLLGSGSAVRGVLEGTDPGVLSSSWSAQVEEFRRKAAAYFLYPE